MKKILPAIFCTIIIIQHGYGQNNPATDTLNKRFSFHFQETTITQDKPGFTAPYSGVNSLQTKAETQTSLTTTLFGAARLWKGAAVIFNPEISGGSGLSSTKGIAGFPNGETFRVGSAEPAIYIARLNFTQLVEWGKDKDTIKDGQNKLQGLRSSRYFSFTLGKFGMADYFDGNGLSHDPRTQFTNWALMDNGAWDYPANTRGYTFGLYTELGQPDWTLRFALTMVTSRPNGADWDAKIGKANTQTLEYERRYTVHGLNGTIRVLGFLNNGKFGNYARAINQNIAAPVVDSTQAYGRHKYGFGISADQYLSKDLGVFARAGYNDGHTQTWFFTEIDRTFTIGGTLKGTQWKRNDDELALAFVINGLSSSHHDYLAAGGYGFLIGDGQLNYSPEMIVELYYKINAFEKKFWLTPDYQFILHPAYNADRGPVNVFSLRAHMEF